MEVDAARRPVVFLSHHSSQADTARGLKRLLARHNIESWLAPDDIAAGDAFDQAIIDQVERSDGIVLLFCANSDQSRHVKRELMIAEDGGKPIYPLRLENVAAKGLAYWLKDYQWIDWFDRRDATIEKLVEQIRRQAGAAPIVTVTPAPSSAARSRRLVWVAIAMTALIATAIVAVLVGVRGGNPVSGDDYVLEPGRWTARRDVLEIVYPDIEPAMAEQIEQTIENDPNPEECIAEEAARSPDVRLFDPGGEGGCTLTNFDMANGRLSGYLVCPLPGTDDGSVMQVTFRGTYTRTTMETDNDITISRPGSMMRFRSRDTSQWLASECAEGQ